MSSARWVGFILVWLALVVFTTDMLANRRRALKTEPAPIYVRRGPSVARQEHGRSPAAVRYDR